MGAGIFAELRRRNVIRMAGLYLVGAWLLVQVASTVLPAFHAADWMLRGLILLLALGFAPVLVIAWVFELTPEGLKRDAEVPPERSIGRQTARRMEHATVVLLALALGYFAFDKFVLAPRREAAIAATAAAVASRLQRESATAIPVQSIAVLPLANESGDKDQQYFSDGLSESLINALAQLQGLKVIGRNSAFQFRDRKDDSKTIGHKLGVANLLEGSVRRVGDVVRITAQLIKASDGSTLWSQQYDRPYKDLFALQDDITRAVSTALKTRLLPGDPGRQSDRPASGNIAAYEAALQGNYHFDQRNQAGVRKAIDAFGRAVQLDPKYAYAWARLATSCAILLQYSAPAPAERARLAVDARAAVANALRLDGSLAEAYLAQGYVALAFDGDVRAMYASNQRAVELAPQNSYAVNRLAASQGYLGQVSAGLETERRAIALDPLATGAYYNAGLFFSALKRYPEAEASLRKAIELRPQSAQYHAYLAIMQALQGRDVDALASAQWEPDPFWRTWALALVQWANGDHAASDAALAELIAGNADDGGTQIALVYAQRGLPEAAFQWLERARKAGDGGVLEIYLAPFMAAYQDDPRFAAFCKKAGLPTPAEVAESSGTSAAASL